MILFIAKKQVKPSGAYQKTLKLLAAHLQVEIEELDENSSPESISA